SLVSFLFSVFCLFLTLFLFFFVLLIPRPPISTLFPYTTLFRSTSVLFLRAANKAASLATLARSAPENPGVRSAISLKLTLGDKRSEEHTSELQSRFDLVCRLLLEKKKKNNKLI